MRAAAGLLIRTAAGAAPAQSSRRRRWNPMGSRKRPRAAHLHEKLRQIREAYGLSQAEMASRLGLADELKQSDISAFEREPDDKWSREPALPHLLRYARVAGGHRELFHEEEVAGTDKEH